MPEVSVVIPTYNRAFVVGDAIRSALEQTFRDIEVIVVDDGSTDNTEEVVKSFGDKRIRYIKLNANRGGAAARNAGIKVAKGKYVAFLDSDDLWLPEKIERQLEVFRTGSPRVGVVYCDSRIETATGIHLHAYRVRGNLQSFFAETVPVGPRTSTIMVRSSLIREIRGFDEQFPALQEYEMQLRLSHACEYDFSDYLGAVVRLGDDSIGTDCHAQLRALELLMKKHRQLFEDSKGGLRCLCYGIAKLHFRAGRTRTGVAYMRNAIRMASFDAKACLHLLCGMFGADFYKLIIEQAAALRATIRFICFSRSHERLRINKAKSCKGMHRG